MLQYVSILIFLLQDPRDPATLSLHRDQAAGPEPNKIACGPNDTHSPWLQRGSNVPGSAGQRRAAPGDGFSGFSISSSQLVAWKKDGFLEVSNRVSTELPLWCTTS